jgi:hypothetical protein
MHFIFLLNINLNSEYLTLLLAPTLSWFHAATYKVWNASTFSKPRYDVYIACYGPKWSLSGRATKDG